MSQSPRVLIIGAGFGGLSAARIMRKADVRVTVIDRRNHHLFQPLLYQVATAALSVAEIAYPIRVLFRSFRNTDVVLGEVIGIDIAGRKVRLSDGQLDYDYLIIAPGSQSAYFGHDLWSESAPPLKTIEDAVEVRRRILLAFEHAEREPNATRRKALLTFVIVGGGSTGIELAGALAELSRRVMTRDFRTIQPRDARIILIEAGTRLLPGFPETLSIRAEESLRRLGVEVLKRTPVTLVHSGGVSTRDQTIDAATVIWAAGVTPSPLARSLGVPLDSHGRVVVQPDLSIPGFPEVFAIGDVAAFVDRLSRPLPGVAPVAIQQGRHAARNIMRLCQGLTTRPFRYVDKGNLVTVGRGNAVASIGSLKLHGFIAWLTWIIVHITYLIGFRNRLVVLVDWASAYLADRWEARLVLCDIERDSRPAQAAQ